MKQNNDTVVVIGLDGATWKILEPLMAKGELPYLTNLRKTGVSGICLSPLPPLTGASWVSFATATSPGKHGIFDFIDKSGKLISALKIKRPRLWEMANKRGMRSCIINMPVTYPTGQLNGYMISSFLTPQGTEIAYPKELEKKIRKWGYVVDIENGFLPENRPPTKTTFKKIRELVERRLRIAKKLLLEEEWNLFFVLVKGTDLVQHYDFDGKETERVYRVIDKKLREMVEGFRKKHPNRQVHVLVISDHGFHRSAQWDVAFYPILRKVGIYPKVPEFMLKVGRMLRKLGFKKLFARGRIGTYGMFVEDKKRIREIMAKLKRVKIKGKRVFSEVVETSKLYGKSYSKEIPDILWVTNKEFAPNADPLSSKIVYTKKTVLKGHHYADREGIFIINSPRIKKGKTKGKARIEEVGSLVCELLEIPSQTIVKQNFVRLKSKKLPVEKKVEEAREFIRKVLKNYKNPAIAWTGGKDSTVLLHLIKSVTKKKLSVMFIDHQNHFEETLEFVRKLQKEWRLNLVVVGDSEAIQRYKREREIQKRKELARMVKINSIRQAIEEYGWDGLFVGIRHDEHPARSKEVPISKREKHDRIHPILKFTEKDIWDYIFLYKVPYNPLYDKGYRSVGEKEFTFPVYEKNAGERAGREKEKEQIMEKLRKLGYF